MTSPSLERLIQRAVTYQKCGDHQRSIAIYNGLIRRGHVSARILTNLGAALYEAGQSDAALQCFYEALEKDSSWRDAWENLCYHAIKTKNHETVKSVVNKVIAGDPGHRQANYLNAQILMSSGNFSDSAEILARMIIDDPDNLELRESIARCALACGDIDLATCHLLYLLSLNPGDAFASIELSEIAAKTGDIDSSIKILESAHASNPSDTLIIQSLAQQLQLVGRMHEALSQYELALTIDPSSPHLMANLAYCFSEIGDVDKFLEISNAIIEREEISPQSLIPIIFVCSTRGIEYLDKLKKYSMRYWDFFPSRVDDSASGSSTSRPEDNSNYAARCIVGPLQKRKIGVVTGGLGTHVESCFLASCLLNYSKDIFDVEIISSRWLNDRVSEALSKSVEQCHSISGLDSQAAAELVLNQGYDTIIETSGFTGCSAIDVLARRCAAVQCHWIGYHASTYMDNMDYFIGDNILIPEENTGQFSEQVVRLNRAWLAATPFTAIPEAEAPKDRQVVFGSFSQISKLTPKTLELWAAILNAVQNSKIVFKDKFVMDRKMVDKVQSFLARKGINPERIIMIPRSSDWFQHLTMYSLIDIALDTTPWSSATTAFDALSMGVPMIGMKGSTTSGLMSCSVLHHYGRQEWVAQNADEYLIKNLTLAEQFTRLRQERRQLQADVLSSQLFDGKGMALAIEEFLLGI